MTDRYAVIGHPISHSKSPLIHGIFAKSTAQDIDYIPIDSPLGEFRRSVEAFRREGGRGMNVTAPFKLEAYELADSLHQRARLAGAVNAMKFDEDGVAADNFDGLGLLHDIQHNLGLSLKAKRVLLLGAGGAARGALLPFIEQEPACLVIANRTVARAHGLAAQVDGAVPVTGVGFDDLGGERFDVVVNATSASLRGELPPLSPAVFGSECLAYELAYGKGLTPFLRLAQNAGVRRLADGVGMLVEQAAASFAWWRGMRPDTRPVIDRLIVPLV